MNLEAKIIACAERLGKKARRDPRTLEEFKIRNDLERVKRILVKRYKRYD